MPKKKPSENFSTKISKTTTKWFWNTESNSPEEIKVTEKTIGKNTYHYQGKKLITQKLHDTPESAYAEVIRAMDNHHLILIDSLQNLAATRREATNNFLVSLEILSQPQEKREKASKTKKSKAKL